MTRLNGEQKAELQRAILDAFDRDGLRMLLLERLDKDLSQISLGKNLKIQVFDVIVEAEKEGWTVGLLNAIIAERPALKNLHALCEQLRVVVESPEPEYEAAPPILTGEQRRLEMEYLRAVRDAYDMARLFGLESAPTARPNPRRKLTEVFVPVTLRRFSPPLREEVERALTGKTGLDIFLAWRELSHTEDRSGSIVPLADLLTLSDRLAIVGGAGSGKSTVLAHLASTLADARLSGRPAPYRIPANRSASIPLVIPLRYYRDYLEKCQQNTGKQLDDPRTGTLAGFIPWHLRRRYPAVGAPESFFDALLKSGECLLMLDGLDEIANREQRGQVREEVDNLVRDVYPRNQVVVTAREAGYRDEAVFGDDFVRLDVQDLEAEQIELLVDRWCRQLYPEDVGSNRKKLVEAITYINELRQERNLPPLINTPLMTTMVVSVQWGETELPHERARLYEACVKVILQAQYIPDDPSRKELVNWGGAWEAQRDWLSSLALSMHQQGRGGAAVRQERILEILDQELDPATLKTFIEAVRYRGGLFEERAEFFQFIHLTFQEFLAARLLAKQREGGWTTLGERVGESWWREVLLLVYGFLRMDYAPAARTYLHWLSSLNGDPGLRLVGAELAGSAVLELERPDPELRRRQADLLVTLLTDRTLSVAAPLRARAGQTLARLGDPREGVGVKDGLPDIQWSVPILAGPFPMGNSQETDPEAYDDEAPRHDEEITAPYCISIYPITNAQYDAFVQDGGYTEQRWRDCWTDVGRQWKGDRTGPDKVGGVFDLPNHPVVSITWYEAVAFCNWLSEKSGRNIELPTEAQWERAARGTDGRRYPWNGEITPDHANYDMNVGTTTAAGIFPLGAAECGAQDMSGNVWEWCQTKWRGNYDSDPDDNLDRDAARVVRGGSWIDNQWYARCAYRVRYAPDVFYFNLGFRVALSLSS